MPIKITVSLKNYEAAIGYLDRVRTRLRKPEVNKAVTRVALFWASSYRSEGAAVGGWAQLAERTVEDRLQQNYPGSHPIMRRQGVLYALSTQFFVNKKKSSTSKRGTRYDGRISTTASLKFSPGEATLRISGPKVFNQWPGIRQTRPARPFWFVTPQTRQAAKSGMIDWVVNDVIKKA